jgi:NTE family protein
MAEDYLGRLFQRAGPTFTLRGGEALAQPGQPVDALYRLEAGRIAELKPNAEGGSSLLALHRPGAVLGGAEALGDGIHHTALVALRDSALRALPMRKAERFLRRDPHVLADVARMALGRLGAAEPEARRRTAIIGFVAVCDSIDMRGFVEALAAELRRLGKRVVVLGAEASRWEPSRLSPLEEAHDLVLMAAGLRETDFISFCTRQVDRLVLVGTVTTPPHAGPLPLALAATAIRAHRLMDLILVWPPGARRISGSDAWLSAVPASRVLQVRRGDAADTARLARVYGERSVGLVLSGGGARAYAHVGVIRALGEMGVPIDFIAGTSMGAIIGAGLAVGWSIGELEERLRDAFVASSPLGDIALPILAMSRGVQVEARLARHFGDVRIGDLWRPFACVSTDLTHGGRHVFRQGLLREALRATLSLPGVLPPVVRDGRVLVDGALVANLPVDLVSEQHQGWTIGVDVAQSAGLTPDDLMLKPSGWGWVTSGAWRRGPPIVSVLMRAATVATDAAMAETRQALDVTVSPVLDGVELRDWKAYEPAVAAGYSAALAVADQLARMAA